MLLWLKKICVSKWFSLVPALLLASLTYCILSEKQSIPVEFYFADRVPESKFGSFYVFVPVCTNNDCWYHGAYQVLCAKPNADRTVFKTRIPKKAKIVYFSANLPHSEQILKKVRVGKIILTEQRLSIFNQARDGRFLRVSGKDNGMKIVNKETIMLPGIRLDKTSKYAGFPIMALAASVLSGAFIFILWWSFPRLQPHLHFLITYRRFWVNTLLFFVLFNIVLALLAMMTGETPVSVKMKQPGKYSGSLSCQYGAFFKPVLDSHVRANMQQTSSTELTANVLPITQTVKIYGINWRNVDQLKIGAHSFSAEECRSILSANTNYVCVYHFENELGAWRRRTAMIFMGGNLLFIVCVAGIFYLMYRRWNVTPAKPCVHNGVETIHRTPKTVTHIFFSAIVIGLLLFCFYRLNALQLQQVNWQPIMHDEVLYSATAAEIQAGIADADSTTRYPHLYFASPAIHTVQGYLNRFIGSNPEFYKIELWLYRNVQLILLIAFVFFFVPASLMQKFFWAAMVLLLHHCMPVIATYSNNSGLGIAILYFTISAYILFFRDDSNWFVFLAGVFSGLAYLGRISLFHFPLALGILYFYVRSNLTRQYALTIKKCLLFFIGFGLLWAGFKWMEFRILGPVSYSEWKIHCTTQLYGPPGIRAGAWSCAWFMKNFIFHFMALIKQYGIFVYVYCALLIYSILKLITFDDKKISRYLPAVAIVIGFAQIFFFFCLQMLGYYIRISYLLSLMGLSSVFLFSQKKNSAYPLTILFCCLLWTAPNIVKLRSLEKLNDVRYPLQFYTVNHALCAIRYPDLPLLVYKNPPYYSLDQYAQLRMSKPDFRSVSEPQDVIAFVKNRDALLCLHQSKLHFLKSCTGIKFRQVEAFGKFVWFYASCEKTVK